MKKNLVRQIRVSESAYLAIAHAAVDADIPNGEIVGLAWDAYSRRRVRALLLLEERGTAEELKGIDFALRPYTEQLERGLPIKRREKLA